MPKTKKEVKKVVKKEMKKAPEKSVKAIFTPELHKKLINPILSKAKGSLTLVENKHGAIQVKRGGDLMFSFRKDGKAIISHPMYDGKERIYKCGGNKWDHLSQVPFAEVTLKMLEDRVSDKKSAMDYHNEIYKKRPNESGLFSKAEAAKVRAAKVTNIVGKATKTAKREKVAAKSALIRQKPVKTKLIKKVTKKVAEEVTIAA